MTTAQLLAEINTLSHGERALVVEETLRQLTPAERKPIERLIRRLQHPDVPESFWQGVEDHEDDRTVDMETALRETPPGRK
jgi:hypothetical protein